MQVFQFKAHSKEWHKIRKKVITATKISALVGLNKYNNLKTIKDNKEIPDNKYMRNGRMLENVCLESAREEGYDTHSAAPPGYVTFIVDDSKNIGCSLDGVCYDDHKGLMLVECKTVNKGDTFKTWLKQPPIEYLIQMQTQMGCAHIENSLYIGVHNTQGFPTVIYTVKFNKKVFDLLQKQVILYNKKELLEVDKDVKKQIEDIIYEGVEKVKTSWLEIDTKFNLDDFLK